MGLKVKHCGIQICFLKRVVGMIALRNNMWHDILET